MWTFLKQESKSNQKITNILFCVFNIESFNFIKLTTCQIEIGM